MDSIERLRDRLRIVAIERVRDELDKLLAVPRPEMGLQLLLETGLAGVFLGGRAASHPTDVQVTMAAVGRATRGGHRRLSVLAHVVEPADPSALVGRLKASNDTKARVSRLVGAIVELGALDTTWDDETVRRFVARRAAGLGEALDGAFDVARARWFDQPDRSRAVEQAISAIGGLVAAEDLTDLAIPLTGHDIQRLLGLVEGPEIGRALGALTEHRLRFGPLDRSEAEAFVVAWFEHDQTTGS